MCSVCNASNTWFVTKILRGASKGDVYRGYILLEFLPFQYKDSGPGEETFEEVKTSEMGRMVLPRVELVAI